MTDSSVVLDQRKQIATRAGIGAILLAAITALFPALVGPKQNGEAIGYFWSVAMSWISIDMVFGSLLGRTGMGLDPRFVSCAVIQYVGCSWRPSW